MRAGSAVRFAIPSKSKTVVIEFGLDRLISIVLISRKKDSCFRSFGEMEFVLVALFSSGVAAKHLRPTRPQLAAQFSTPSTTGRPSSGWKAVCCAARGWGGWGRLFALEPCPRAACCAARHWRTCHRHRARMLQEADEETTARTAHASAAVAQARTTRIASSRAAEVVSSARSDAQAGPSRTTESPRQSARYAPTPNARTQSCDWRVGTEP
jgi:hypothetical protein